MPGRVWLFELHRNPRMNSSLEASWRPVTDAAVLLSCREFTNAQFREILFVALVDLVHWQIFLAQGRIGVIRMQPCSARLRAGFLSDSAGGSLSSLPKDYRLAIAASHCSGQFSTKFKSAPARLSSGELRASIFAPGKCSLNH